MKSAPFTYHRPSATADALDLLGRLDNARALAGGQSLMPMLNFRYAAFDHLVDLNRVAELAGVELGPTQLRIRAMTRQNDLLINKEIARRCPILIEAVRNVGHLPTRTRGTFGGSLAHMDPAAELLGIAALHDAEITIASKTAQRRVPVGQFSIGYMTPDLAPGELLLDAAWPLWPERHGYCFLEFAQRPGDFAIVGAGALLTLKDERTIGRAAIVLIGIDKGPVRLSLAEAGLVGAPIADASWRGAADAVSVLEPMQDAIATTNYRRRLARTLVERALRTAAERAANARAAA